MQPSFEKAKIPKKPLDKMNLRFGDLILDEPASRRPPSIVLLGFPTNQGVIRNNGRPGAADGPDAIREALFRLCPSGDHSESMHEVVSNMVDLGNLKLSGDLACDQELLGDVVAKYLLEGSKVIILGGDHSTTYGHFLGYVKAKRKICILNWDQHVDVKDLIEGQPHSGSPFRQSILHPSNLCINYTVAGLLPHSVSLNHIEFLKTHSSRFYWKDELNPEKIEEIYNSISEGLLVTFDMDVIDQPFAPGVSYPAIDGIAPQSIYKAAFYAGKHQGVSSIDICEMNPKFDRDGQTARVAALTIWKFINGFQNRSSCTQK